VVDFADLALDKDGKIPEYIAQLGREKKKIFLKGYMYQSQRLSGLDNFILVRTVEHCKYCSVFSNPADMIGVYFIPGMKVNYRTSSVKGGGTFVVIDNYQKDTHYGAMPYTIIADQFR